MDLGYQKKSSAHHDALKMFSHASNALPEQHPLQILAQLIDVQDKPKNRKLTCKILITSILIPASLGLHGPGEIIKKSGFIFSISEICHFIITLNNKLYVQVHQETD